MVYGLCAVCHGVFLIGGLWSGLKLASWDPKPRPQFLCGALHILFYGDSPWDKVSSANQRKKASHDK